jgi:hypothetical protein
LGECPTSFITIWKGNELIAFFGKIPLHPEILQVLATEPLLQPFVREWKPIPNSFLLSLLGIQPELEVKTRAYIINTIINHLSFSEWIIDFTCLKEWFPVFELCGFERASWADATSEFGTEYRAFVLDLTQEDFLTKLDRALANGTLEETLVHDEPPRDVQGLKTLLKEFTNLPKDPALSGIYIRLFPHRAPKDLSFEKLGQYIQQDLMNLINDLTKGTDREATLGKLLKSTYIQGIRPHERVAERFSLSMATYYRYLNKAYDRLYQLLVFHNPKA